MSGYAPVTPEIAARLEAICGRNYVIYRDEERLEPYSHDEIPGRHYRRLPEVVVRPQTTAEVSAIVQLANAEHIPVTPRGAGSGLLKVLDHALQRIRPAIEDQVFRQRALFF